MSSVDPSKLETQTFDWGIIKWLVSPDITPGANITFGQVVLLAIYNPGGAERALGDLPDFRKVPAGKAPKLKRA